ncbi:50S ribosomal protein L5 [archaeon]|nr:50S ribosomal protein L5 [archaeon]
MRNLRVEKVTLNMGCGTKTSLDHAKLILEKVSEKTVVITRTYKRSTFNVPKDKPIGCKVTIRKGSQELLKKLLETIDNKLAEGNFDNHGNFSFGVKEYIDVPGMEYDPKIGILGFDVCVTLERPGYRIKRKKLSKKLGKKHMITKEDAIAFTKERFGVKIE